MTNYLIITSSILALISPLTYVYAILKGQAKPHRTTRLVLLLITSLTTISLFPQQDRGAIYLAAVSTLQSVIIFILSLKYGMGGYAKSDLTCLGIALLGIILWQVTQNPILGLYSAILADFTGMIPALVKTFYKPETESWYFYGLDVGAALFSTLAINSETLSSYAYPLYILLINLIMVLLIVRPRFNLLQAKS